MKKKSKSKAQKPSDAHVIKKSILKRKQLRKEKRQAKKVAKKDYANKKFRGNLPRNKADDEEIPSSDDEQVHKVKEMNTKVENKQHNEQQKLKKDMKELKRQQKKQRKQQLILANEAEEKNIKFLEKNLGLKRRKSKNLPKSFLDDGLDYLLDACDSKKIANFGADENMYEDEELMADMLNGGSDGDDNEMEESEIDDENEDSENGENDEFMSDGGERNDDSNNDDAGSDSDEPEDVEEDCDFYAVENSDQKNENEGKENNEWEDIYGRKRDSKGNIIEPTDSSTISSITPTKYIPPALRNKMNRQGDSEQKRIALERLSKQIKGLLNRLAESNMHGICREIEGFYNSNSRNDVNQTVAGNI